MAKLKTQQILIIAGIWAIVHWILHSVVRTSFGLTNFQTEIFYVSIGIAITYYIYRAFIEDRIYK